MGKNSKFEKAAKQYILRASSHSVMSFTANSKNVLQYISVQQMGRHKSNKARYFHTLPESIKSTYITCNLVSLENFNFIYIYIIYIFIYKTIRILFKAHLLILYISFASKGFSSDNGTVVNSESDVFTTVSLSLMKSLQAKLMYRINKCALKSILIVLYSHFYQKHGYI